MLKSVSAIIVSSEVGLLFAIKKCESAGHTAHDSHCTMMATILPESHFLIVYLHWTLDRFQSQEQIASCLGLTALGQI